MVYESTIQYHGKKPSTILHIRGETCPEPLHLVSSAVRKPKILYIHMCSWTSASKLQSWMSVTQKLNQTLYYLEVIVDDSSHV